MRRREMLALATVAAAFSVAPSWACREPRAKDRNAYLPIIHGILAAWWRRDYADFNRYFQHPDVAEPFRGRAAFDQYFEDQHPR